MKFFRSIIITCLVLSGSQLFAQRQMENLTRELVAINQGNGKVFISWRRLCGLIVPFSI